MPDLGESGHLLREVHDSPGALARWLAFGLFLTLLGGLGLFIGLSPGSQPAALASGAVLLVAGLLFVWPLIRRALTLAAPVIAMDDVGLFDRRLSAQFFRWNDILSILPFRYRGRIHGVIIELPLSLVTPQTFAFAPIRGLVALVKRWFGARSVTLVVTALGTEVDGTQLYQWCLAYSRTHKFEVEKQNV